MLSQLQAVLSPGILPCVLLLTALVLFALTCRGCLSHLLPPEGEKPRFSFVRTLSPMTKKDRLFCLVITLLYAATAFFRLGSLTAPQTTVDFVRMGTVEVELPQTVYSTGFRCFFGLGTGSYHVEISSDGQHWSALWPEKKDENDPGKVTGYYWANAEGYSPSYALSQGYNDLFRWRDIRVSNPQNVKYIRLTPKVERDTLQLGELVLLGQEGEPLSLSVSGTAAPLFDEWDTCPEKDDWYTSAYFDEIYHPRTALEHLENVQPYETTHPPLGKLIIALGISLFGMIPFGWRFMGVLFGVLMLPLLYTLLKNLFGRTSLACCGTLLLAFDFMHLTQTRLATIDTYAVFFILGSFLFFCRWLTLPVDAPLRTGMPHLFLAGLFFGLGAACKWTVLYAGAGMAVLYLLKFLFSLREREQLPLLSLWGKTVLLSLVFFVVIPLSVYTLSYYPYAVQEGDTTLAGLVKVMAENQSHMFGYHQGVTASHPYASKWWMWMLDIRPILYYMDTTIPNTTLRIAAFVNPLVCWGGLLALVLLLWPAVRRRDGMSLLLLMGWGAQVVFWIPISRPTFHYHYFPAVPFLILALCYLLHLLAEHSPVTGKRWMVGLTAAAGGLYAAFYPVLVGLPIPSGYAALLRWLPSWPV